MSDRQKIIDEYPDKYCYALELAYGPGMMSEGGPAHFDKMFKGVDIANKKLLDVGFGLGGVAFYLAEKKGALVKGVEINPWMVEEATRRIPDELKDRVSFRCYEETLPFDDGEFDIIYSKGVLCHLKDKEPLFRELIRVLRPGGQLIINDWLSPTKNQWSERIREMCELEDLTLYAETELGYEVVLSNAGFDDICFENANEHYAAYNRQVADSLAQDETRKKFINKYSETDLQDAINGYQLIANAVESNELLIRHITAIKPESDNR